jgi:alcohol dehydrogenase, propanol-preferring
MRAVTFVEPGRVEIAEVPDPVPRPGEVLVQVRAAGLCHTDVHIRRGLDKRATPKMVLGHEIAGIVAATSDGETRWSAGDPVAVYPLWACARCAPCIAGQQNACQGTGDRRRTPPTPGVSVNGGMAELVAVPTACLVEIGQLEPFVAASMTDAALSPYASINAVRERLAPGAWAVVIGVGGLGSMAVQILRATTAARVVAVDQSVEALANVASWIDDARQADEPGLSRGILEQTGGYGANVVFDFVGADTTLALAADVVAPFGAVQVSGMAGGSVRLTADATCRLPRGASITPRMFGGTRAELGDVLRLAEAAALVPNITAYPFEAAVQAFDDLEAGRIHGRAVLCLGGAGGDGWHRWQPPSGGTTKNGA